MGEVFARQESAPAASDVIFRATTRTFMAESLPERILRMQYAGQRNGTIHHVSIGHVNRDRQLFTGLSVNYSSNSSP